MKKGMQKVLLVSVVGLSVFWLPMFCEMTDKQEQVTALAGISVMIAGMVLFVKNVFKVR